MQVRELKFPISIPTYSFLDGTYTPNYIDADGFQYLKHSLDTNTACDFNSVSVATYVREDDAKLPTVTVCAAYGVSWIHSDKFCSWPSLPEILLLS